MSLSIIQPFYKRSEDFKIALENNKKFLSRDIELVLVLDEPDSEQEVLAIMQGFKGVRWKALINRVDHPWRNPSRALNVGIRNASHDTVFVSSPETFWLNNVPAILHEGVLKEPDRFHCGVIAFANPDEVKNEDDFKKHCKGYTYGSICLKKEHLERICGYDESLVGWGGDDDNLRARLRLTKCFDRTHREAFSFHPRMIGSHRFHSEDTKSRIEDIVRPQDAVANRGQDWGMDFSEIFYEA